MDDTGDARRPPDEDVGDGSPPDALSGETDDLAEVPEGVRASWRAMRQEWLELRRGGWDAGGLLPLLTAVLPEVQQRLADGQALGVLLVGVQNLSQIEEAFGWESADALLARVTDLARQFGAAGAPTGTVLAREGPFGEEVVLLVPFAGGGAPGVTELTGLSGALHAAVEAGLEGRDILRGARVATGHAVLFRNPARRLERSVARAVHSARTMLRGEGEQARLERALDLAGIIDRANLTVAYQPIVTLADRSILGYEALCRGPRGTPFEVADFLFASSHELELAHELDHACRQLILARRPPWPAGRLLFINVLPEALVSGLATPQRLLEALAGSSIGPRQIVLEMLERGRVTDWGLFRARLAAFREAGFQVAVDDVGTGVSSLRLVPEVVPDFLKVDLSLVRGIHRSRAQQGVLVTLVELAARVGAEVICEGIEEAEELDVIESLGAHHGQGFLLARPAEVPLDELPG